MSSKEIVTVIIPTYNRGDSTVIAIESVLEQNYDSLEILVVDDFSIDGSYDYLCKKYKEEKKVSVMRRCGDVKGANAARMTGLKNAKGKYIAFLDSDDQLVANSISCRVDWLRTHMDTDMVYGDCIVKGDRVCYDNIQEKNQHKYLMEELSLCEYGVIMIRRELVDKLGEIDISLKAWQDDDMVLSIDRCGGHIEHCGEAVLIHNFSSVSITSNYWNRYYGCKAVVSKYKADIISECGFRRFILWKLRIVYDWCEAYGKKNDILYFQKKIVGWLQYICFLVCKKYFRHMYG